MSNDPDSPPQRKPPAAADRQAERAEALRANLMRRKAQARSRNETHAPQPKPPADA